MRHWTSSSTPTDSTPSQPPCPRESRSWGIESSILDCTTLAVFKVFFNRTKDWADLEAMFEAGQLDVDVVAAFVRDLPGEHDLRIDDYRSSPTIDMPNLSTYWTLSRKAG